MSDQFVDPGVSRAKFARELAAFQQFEAMHRARGWWLMSAEFPIVQIGFLTPKARPVTLAVCARLDFTNYDLWPPSVRFVDPFTGAVLNLEQVGLPFARLTPSGIVNLLQGHAQEPAFLCLPGVREYHDHPAHTGDSWFLHRAAREGSLQFIADKISRFGTEPVVGMQMQVRPVLAATPVAA